MLSTASVLQLVFSCNVYLTVLSVLRCLYNADIASPRAQPCGQV